MPIKAGEMFLLPAKIPHSPVRPANSVGLVIERKRKPHHKDGLMWFSDKENALLYEEYFHLTNIEKDFLPADNLIRDFGMIILAVAITLTISIESILFWFCSGVPFTGTRALIGTLSG